MVCEVGADGQHTTSGRGTGPPEPFGVVTVAENHCRGSLLLSFHGKQGWLSPSPDVAGLLHGGYKRCGEQFECDTYTQSESQVFCYISCAI